MRKSNLLKSLVILTILGIIFDSCKFNKHKKQSTIKNKIVCTNNDSNFITYCGDFFVQKKVNLQYKDSSYFLLNITANGTAVRTLDYLELNAIEDNKLKEFGIIIILEKHKRRPYNTGCNDVIAVNEKLPKIYTLKGGEVKMEIIYEGNKESKKEIWSFSLENVIFMDEQLKEQISLQNDCFKVLNDYNYPG